MRILFSRQIDTLSPVLSIVPPSAPYECKFLIIKDFRIFWPPATSLCYKRVEHGKASCASWWARLAVPQRLREATGRREFIQSCRTHELHIAKLVASILVACWRRQLLALESNKKSMELAEIPCMLTFTLQRSVIAKVHDEFL